MTKQLEVPTVAAASAVLADLEAKLVRHRARAVELEASRKQASFGAHALHDAKQRKQLADVVDQTIRHETEARAIADAIDEAKRRLMLAQAYADDVAARANAEHIFELLGAFREAGVEMDQALRTVAEVGKILPSLLSQLHAAGVSSPNHEQMDALGFQALGTALMDGPWRRRFEHLAPSSRRTFGSLFDQWAMAIESQLRRRLRERQEAA
ncbi:MAG: hypothetical protein WAK04_08435 [Xanthobacteraceae bacterium]